jgi:hypothetical protein
MRKVGKTFFLLLVVSLSHAPLKVALKDRSIQVYINIELFVNVFKLDGLQTQR